MSAQDIETAYERMLQRWDFSFKPRTAGRERRVHPRFSVGRRNILVSAEIHAPAFDVSLSGLSFRSSLRFDPGARITIRLGQAISGAAIVVACEPERGDPVAGPIEYRVRCAFEEETVGMPLVVVLSDPAARKAGSH
jgi:hypothetical protein